jgi:hypothetical protein
MAARDEETRRPTDGRFALLDGQVWFRGEARPGAYGWVAGVVALLCVASVLAVFVAPWVGGLVAVLAAAQTGWALVRPPPTSWRAAGGVLRAGGETIPVGPVRLEGRPGGWQHVYVGEELVFRTRPAGDEAMGMADADLTTFTEALAQALGVERTDERDRAAIARWEQDPVTRARLRLAWDRDDAALRLPDLFDRSVQEPRVEGDIGRVTYLVGGSGLRIDARSVEDLPLGSIDEVALIDDGIGRALRLVARAGTDRHVLMETGPTPEMAAQLRFVARRLREAIGRDHGTADEVPVALAALATEGR